MQTGDRIMLLGVRAIIQKKFQFCGNFTTFAMLAC